MPSWRKKTEVLHGDLRTIYSFIKQLCLQVYLKAQVRDHLCMQQFLLVWILLVLVMSFLKRVSPLNVSASALVKWVRLGCGSLDILDDYRLRYADALLFLCFSYALARVCVCVCGMDALSIVTPDWHKHHTAINDQLLIGWDHEYAQTHPKHRGCSHRSLLTGCRDMVSFTQLI